MPYLHSKTPFGYMLFFLFFCGPERMKMYDDAVWERAFYRANVRFNKQSLRHNTTGSYE